MVAGVTKKNKARLVEKLRWGDHVRRGRNLTGWGRTDRKSQVRSESQDQEAKGGREGGDGRSKLTRKPKRKPGLKSKESGIWNLESGVGVGGSHSDADRPSPLRRGGVVELIRCSRLGIFQSFDEEDDPYGVGQRVMEWAEVA